MKSISKNLKLRTRWGHCFYSLISIFCIIIIKFFTSSRGDLDYFLAVGTTWDSLITYNMPFLFLPFLKKNKSTGVIIKMWLVFTQFMKLIATSNLLWTQFNELKIWKWVHFPRDFYPDLMKVNISNLSSPQKEKLLEIEASSSNSNNVKVM